MKSIICDVENITVVVFSATSLEENGELSTLANLDGRVVFYCTEKCGILDHRVEVSLSSVRGFVRGLLKEISNDCIDLNDTYGVIRIDVNELDASSSARAKLADIKVSVAESKVDTHIAVSVSTDALGNKKFMPALDKRGSLILTSIKRLTWAPQLGVSKAQAEAEWASKWKTVEELTNGSVQSRQERLLGESLGTVLNLCQAPAKKAEDSDGDE